jgi:penicillin G amidase
MAKKRIRTWVNLGLSLVVGGGVIFGLSNSLGPLPALARAMNPGTGVWTSASSKALQVSTQELKLHGLQKSVTVLFEKDGTPHIQAQTTHDAWLALGYLQAKDRLFQMDLMRRQGEGLLSEVVGSPALESDQFQRQLDLTRTADAEWATANPEVKDMLTAYSAGINENIDRDLQEHSFPLMFNMLDYTPKHWTPQDTLVLKGVLTQMMSFDHVPVYYQLFSSSLGYDRTMQLFPVLPVNEQHPYAPGPYAKATTEPMPISAERMLDKQVASTGAADNDSTQHVSAAPQAAATTLLATTAATDAALHLLQDTEDLGSLSLHRDPNSNAWAVGSDLAVGNKPLLAGDPHLDHTLPAIWYQAEIQAPDLHVSGNAVPGIPLFLVGRNDHISFSLTDGQNQQTFYYQEKTDAAHPDEYEWNGQWQKFQTRQEVIPVKGEHPQTFTIKSTVHGPVMDQHGLSLAVDWVGTMPSQALGSLLKVNQADSVASFRDAMKDWVAPIMNFVCTDDQGHIGILGAGTYAVFPTTSKPWMPMSGTGENDIIGKIPFANIPQSWDPKDHIIDTANQRQVSSDYPYYIGTSLHFDTGYRAQRIYDVLSQPGKRTAEDMQALQNDTVDVLATRILPTLRQTLHAATLTPEEQTAMKQLDDWHGDLAVNSVGGTIWSEFWNQYMSNTYQPWWDAKKIPYTKEKRMVVSVLWFPLVENLEVWTLHDPNNAMFNNPQTGAKRTAQTVMLQAFQDSVQKLQSTLGTDVSTWTYGRTHTVQFPSLAEVDALGSKPYPAGGDDFTVNYAGGKNAVHGPSVRMVTDWSTRQTVGNYPGGQSENPVSSLYNDRLPQWLKGEYSPYLSYQQVQSEPTHVTWTLTPEQK